MKPRVERPPDGRPRASVYCRISNDPEGREKGVDRQEQDCRALAERLGYEVVAVYVENDVSASTSSKKPRPQYDAMIRAVKAGQVDAILAYSLSRLTRRVREFLDLIELYQRTGVEIRTCVSGDPNLSTADGRGAAITLATWDAAEAERTAERVRRAKEQAVAEGRYRGGPRPYGFNKDGVTVREKEAEVIRRATKAVIEGRTLTAVVNELNESGSRTSRKAEWTRHSLRDMLLRHRNAGLIASGKVRKGAKAVANAVWEPIVSEEEFRAVEAILLDPQRRTAQNLESKWLGSSIYECGYPTPTSEDPDAICGHPMRSFSVKRGGGKGPRGEPARRLPAYKCSRYDHVMVMAVKTDEHVRRAVVEALRDERVVRALTAAKVQQEGGAVDPLHADRERRRLLTRSIEQTEKDYDDDLIDARRYKAKIAKIEDEIAQIDERMALGMQQAATNPVLLAVDPAAAFMEAPLDVQRAILRTVMRVVILPRVGPSGGAWSPDRLLILPAVATEQAKTEEMTA